MQGFLIIIGTAIAYVISQNLQDNRDQDKRKLLR
jgi:hypothetical protein